VEFFAADDIVFFGKVGGDAAVVSRSLPPHLQMFSLQFSVKIAKGSLFAFALRQPFDFFNLLLQFGNTLFSFDKVFRVIKGLGITFGVSNNKQISDADINADRLSRLRQRLDNLLFINFYQEGYPVPVCFARQANLFDFPLWQRFVRAKLDNSNVGKLNPACLSVKLSKVGSVAEPINKGTEFTWRFKFRKICLFLEETLNGIRKAFANSKLPCQRVDFVVGWHLLSKVEPNLIQVVIGEKLSGFTPRLPTLVNLVFLGKQIVISAPTPPQKVVYLFSLLPTWLRLVLSGYYHFAYTRAIILAQRSELCSNTKVDKLKEVWEWKKD